ncbi:MAG: GlcNAc-PI de-N-acetylase, partial [Galactobacter sp.]
DSGMRWIREGLAGPADGTDTRTFTSAELDEEVADLLALIRSTSPDVILGYDREGSYGHPDHIRAHELAAAAATAADLPLVEIASSENAEGFTWCDLSSGEAQAVAALRCHATQLQVLGGEIVHVGGQHQALPLRSGLRRVR